MTYKRQQKKEIDKYNAEKSRKHFMIIFNMDRKSRKKFIVFLKS